MSHCAWFKAIFKPKIFDFVFLGSGIDSQGPRGPQKRVRGSCFFFRNVFKKARLQSLSYSLEMGQERRPFFPFLLQTHYLNKQWRRFLFIFRMPIPIDYLFRLFKNNFSPASVLYFTQLCLGRRLSVLKYFVYFVIF